ncbi:hypothetical protein GFV14_00748 [Candidatus Hartigia pinicola]|nr:hypothetical protein GFV14_00748 [Candidatus Hartigia pinicola]
MTKKKAKFLYTVLKIIINSQILKYRYNLQNSAIFKKSFFVVYLLVGT